MELTQIQPTTTLTPAQQKVITLAEPPKDEAEAQQKVKDFPSGIKTMASAVATKMGKVWGEMSWLERFELCAQAASPRTLAEAIAREKGLSLEPPPAWAMGRNPPPR